MKIVIGIFLLTCKFTPLFNYLELKHLFVALSTPTNVIRENKMRLYINGAFFLFLDSLLSSLRKGAIICQF